MPHTEECRKRIGEKMEHDPEGRERLQVHKRRRDVEPEVEVDRAPVAEENEGDPAKSGTARCRNVGGGTCRICVCKTWIRCCC